MKKLVKEGASQPHVVSCDDEKVYEVNVDIGKYEHWNKWATWEENVI